MYLGDGIYSFKSSLDLKKCMDKYDIWIAYARVNNTTIDNDEYDNHDKSDDIIIYCTVIINNESLVSTHMGISRAHKTFAQQNRHINLSIELHSFMAKISKMLYPQVEYIVTKPADAMRQILVKNLEPMSELWVVSYAERIKMQNLYNYMDTIVKNIKAIEPEKFTEEMHDIEKISKFISNYTNNYNKDNENNLQTVNSIQQFAKTNTEEEFMEKVNIRSYFFKDRIATNALFKKIKTINESNSTNKYNEIISLVENYPSIFRHAYVLEALDHANWRSQQCLQELYPKDFNILPPLRNIGDTWTIIKNDKEITFPKPEWFNSKTMCSHRDLHNALSEVIIDIVKLSQKF